ncbi:MAG: hypothetical protein ACK5Y2_05150 [Bdellovibrionales bacterium]
MNIQHPISQLILSGEKTVETRTYKMPDQYAGEEVFLIETPGKHGKFKARAIARITFGESFEYGSKKSFYADIKRHRVEPGSTWEWKDKKKWGWPIVNVKRLKTPVEIKETRGIVFTKSISVDV